MATRATQGFTARGVRKVNEQVVQEGRALIITEENENLYSWEDIPNGSLKVSGTTGLIMVKIAGQSDWIPSNIRLDIARDQEGNILDINGNKITDPKYIELVEKAISQGGNTISIAHDSIIIRENFTIIDLNVGEGMFSYEDEEGNRLFGQKNDQGYWFELRKGHYQPGRNLLEVIIDDCLTRSAATGGVIEVSETRFIMPEELIEGMELTVKYHQLNRIGNPYPRIYLRKGNYSVSADGYEELTGDDDIYQPENAEVGDIWFDFNGDPDDDDGYIADIIKTQQKVSWDQIDALPGTVSEAAARGIMVDAAVKGHKHKATDVSGIDVMIAEAISHVNSATTATSAQSATKATTADNAQLLQGKTIGNNVNNIVVVQSNGHISDQLISEEVRTITNMVDYQTFMGTIHSAIQSYFSRGMIMAWYGIKEQVPSGWAICDGTKGTPDLSDKFIMGVGRYDPFAVVPAGLPNITGEFGGNGRPCPIPNGAFSKISDGSMGANTSSEGQKISFNASNSNRIYGNSDTVQPPAIAMYFIMKL